MTARILVVTGGRDHVDGRGMLFAPEEAQFVEFVLEYQPTIFRHGDARGVDKAAAAVVKRLGLRCQIQRWPADWTKEPKAAQGPIRNRNMLLGQSASGRDAGGLAHQLVAFKGYKGTPRCIEAAVSLGIPVKHITPVELRSEQGLQHERLMRRRLRALPAERVAIDDQAMSLWAQMTEFDRQWFDHWLKFLRPQDT